MQKEAMMPRAIVSLSDYRSGSWQSEIKDRHPKSEIVIQGVLSILGGYTDISSEAAAGKDFFVEYSFKASDSQPSTRLPHWLVADEQKTGPS